MILLRWCQFRLVSSATCKASTTATRGTRETRGISTNMFYLLDCGNPFHEHHHHEHKQSKKGYCKTVNLVVAGVRSTSTLTQCGATMSHINQREPCSLATQPVKTEHALHDISSSVAVFVILCFDTFLGVRLSSCPLPLRTSFSLTKLGPVRI